MGFGGSFHVFGLFPGGKGGHLKVKKRKYLGGIEEDYCRWNNHSFAHSRHFSCFVAANTFAWHAKCEHVVSCFQRFYILSADI